MSITAANWVAGFQAGSKVLEANVAPWLQPLRHRAFDRFMTEGWPVTKQENWHHTSLANLALQVFYPTAQSSDDHQAAAHALKEMRQGESGHWLVFVNGHFSSKLSDIGVLPAGVQLLPLSQAMVGHADEIHDVFGDELAGSSTAALNLALATDGAFVYLSRGAALDQPVHLAFITTTEQGASFPRNIIVADSGAQASIIEHYTGTNESITLTNAVTRASIATDANISHLKLQQETHQAFHLADIHVQQATKSVYKSHSMSFGAKLARN
ncbi:Fe-S cluster assembly protein SufD, partial [Photobacterium phosphoreum]|nr:Fe-S cluster assembly protein SufD [Photobacterium phosphoreum]